MTFEEMLALDKKGHIRKKSDNKEHRLQSACVRWFRHQYPKLSKVLFAIPNAARFLNIAFLSFMPSSPPLSWSS